MAMEYEDEYTKNQILNQYLNTASYGTNNGKTAVGVEAASQVYFDKDVVRPQRRRGGAARRPPAGAHGLQPVHQPEGRQAAPQRGARGAARPGLHQPRDVLEGRQRGPRAAPRLPLRAALAAVLLRLRPERADRQVRRRHRARGRAEGLHHARPPPAVGRRAGDRGAPGHRRRRGAGLDRRRHRRDQGDGLLLVLRREPVQPRRHGAAPARFLVQALPADDGGRPRASIRTARTTRRQASITLYPYGSLRRGLDRGRRRRGLDQPPRRDRELGQHRLRPAGHRHRLGRHGRDGEEDGRLEPASGRARGRARRQRRHRPRPVERLRDDRQRRRPPRPDRDRQGRLPRRPHRRAARRSPATGWSPTASPTRSPT